MSKIIFHESYGEVTRAQLAAYRKYNVSPSDHDELVYCIGEYEHGLITERVIKLSKDVGYFRVYDLHA